MCYTSCMEELPMHTANVLCPTCSGPTARQYDAELKPTGRRICLSFLTCPQTAFYHIPTAQEIEANGLALAPMHETNLDLYANSFADFDNAHRARR